MSKPSRDYIAARQSKRMAIPVPVFCDPEITAEDEDRNLWDTLEAECERRNAYLRMTPEEHREMQEWIDRQTDAQTAEPYEGPNDYASITSGY